MADPFARQPLGRTGVCVSGLGFGTMGVGGQYTDVTDADASATLAAAWARGLRFFDTAPQYGCGLAEERLGRAAKSWPRSDAVIATKVGKRIAPLGSGGARQATALFPGGHDREMVFDYSYDGTRRQVDESLARLQLDYLDLVLIHDVTRHFHGDATEARFSEAMAGSVAALARLKTEGVVRAFGTGLKDVDIARRFAVEADIDCVLLPGRLTLVDQTGLTEGLLDACRARGVSLIAAGVFDSGILATGPVAGATSGYRPAGDDVRARVARIDAICRASGVPLQAAALSYPGRHQGVAGVLAGMRSAAEVAQNIAWMATPVPDGLWQALADDAEIALPRPGG